MAVIVGKGGGDVKPKFRVLLGVFRTLESPYNDFAFKEDVKKQAMMPSNPEFPLSGTEKERRVQQMFSAVARWYDVNNTVLSLGQHHYWKREAVAEARVGPGARVIDLCAGTADIALLLARQVGPDGHVVAVDLNLEMLRIGRAKIARAGLGDRVSCVLGNVEALEFPDHTFDAATVGFGIRNTAHMEQALAEMYRVLRPGGRGVCLEFSHPPSPWLRRLYDWYSFTLLPRIGRWIAGDSTGIYEYLPTSIRHFPDQEAFCELFRKVGFREVYYRNLTGGIVAIHVGIK